MTDGGYKSAVGLSDHLSYHLEPGTEQIEHWTGIIMEYRCA
jgi:hypothetical protein